MFFALRSIVSLMRKQNKNNLKTKIMKTTTKTTGYSIEWKNKQNNKNGGWAQKHGDSWKWHYIANDTEYSRGEYLTKREAITENKIG